MLLVKDPLPLLPLRIPQLLCSWPDLHHQMLGASHHTDWELPLNLYSSVKNNHFSINNGPRTTLHEIAYALLAVAVSHYICHNS
jgi:hypothetical protein